MWWFILTFAIGLAVGRKKFLPTALLQHPTWIITPTLALLLFFLGLQIGEQPAILRNIGLLGGEGLVIAVFTMAGSALVALGAYRWLLKKQTTPGVDRDGAK